MRKIVALLMCASAAACQAGSRNEGDVPIAGSGTTAQSPAAPPTARSDSVSGGDSAGSADATRDGATLTLDHTEYAPGGTAIMRVTSTTADTLGYNACSSRVVEQQQGARWTVHPEPNRVCTMELRLLLPRESQTAPTTLPRDLTSGTYRIVLHLSRQRATPGTPSPNARTVRAVSPVFRVP